MTPFCFNSLQHILNAGVKMLFIASLNDQVVPLYSALFSSLSHPNILRSIFIDGQAFEASADFMTNLVSAHSIVAVFWSGVSAAEGLED